VQICNVVARTTGRILMTAQNGAWLENVTLRDIRLLCPDLQDPEYRLSADGLDWGASEILMGTPNTWCSGTDDL